MRHGLLESDLPGWVDPAHLFAQGSWPVWLDTGDGNGTSYLGIGTRLATASASEGTVTVDGATSVGSVFDLLRVARSGGTDGFRLGWVGWIGYELLAETMALPVAHPSRRPDAVMLQIDRALAFDQRTKSVRACALTAEGLADVMARFAADSPVSEPQQPVPTGPPPLVSWRYSDEAYLAMIRACQSAIVEGDAYQLCLTNEVFVEICPDPIRTYLALRAASPSHHGSFFSAAGITLLSSSPERFISVTPGGVVESRPIKGTSARGLTPAVDAARALALQADEKERAENLMIVDLMRNDIARVSAVGSVTVPSLLAVETYPQLHQLVSVVVGQLESTLDPIDAVAACFPAGSMTGAPKRRAVELLATLEQRPRGAFAGAFGYFSLDGRIDLAMIIRTIVIDTDGCTIGAGGGITALSSPAAELAEVKLKAAVLLAVLGVTSR